MEKQEIKVGTKIMWEVPKKFQIQHSFVPYKIYKVETIVSETKATFKTDNKHNIKKDTLRIIGVGNEWQKITVEIFDDKKYYEEYILPKKVYTTKKFICDNINKYVEICSDGELSTLYEKIFITLKSRQNNVK